MSSPANTVRRLAQCMISRYRDTGPRGMSPCISARATHQTGRGVVNAYLCLWNLDCPYQCPPVRQIAKGPRYDNLPNRRWATRQRKMMGRLKVACSMLLRLALNADAMPPQHASNLENPVGLQMLRAA